MTGIPCMPFSLSRERDELPRRVQREPAVLEHGGAQEVRQVHDAVVLHRILQRPADEEQAVSLDHINMSQAILGIVLHGFVRT